MLKLLFNIFIIYAIWQLFRMFFAVSRAQSEMRQQMKPEDPRAGQGKKTNSTGQENDKGEYIDYEEIR